MLFHIQVGHAFHVADGRFDLVADLIHFVQVVAEQFDGDAGLRTAQHGIYTMADGLSYFDVRSRYDGQFTSHIL